MTSIEVSIIHILQTSKKNLDDVYLDGSAGLDVKLKWKDDATSDRIATFFQCLTYTIDSQNPDTTRELSIFIPRILVIPIHPTRKQSQ